MSNNLNEDYFFSRGDTNTPKIILDKKHNIFEFSGNSLPEDALSFYTPIIDWFELYKQTPIEKTSVIFKMTYMNSSTSKMIHKIIQKLNEIYLSGHNIKIQWHYHMGDEDMLLDGKTFLEEMLIPHQFIIIDDVLN